MADVKRVDETVQFELRGSRVVGVRRADTEHAATSGVRAQILANPFVLGVVTTEASDVRVRGVFDEPSDAAAYADHVDGEVRFILVREADKTAVATPGRVSVEGYPINPPIGD